MTSCACRGTQVELSWITQPPLANVIDEKLGQITKVPFFGWHIGPYPMAIRLWGAVGATERHTSSEDGDLNTWLCNTLINSKTGNTVGGCLVFSTDGHLPFCTTLAVIPVTRNLIGWHIHSRSVTLSINARLFTHRPAILLSLSCPHHLLWSRTEQCMRYACPESVVKRTAKYETSGWISLINLFLLQGFWTLRRRRIGARQ